MHLPLAAIIVARCFLNYMNKQTVFITGVTGFLGSYLAKTFLDNGHKVYALSRPKKEESAQVRIFKALEFWGYDILQLSPEKLVILEGDILKPDLGLERGMINSLSLEVDAVFHSAAVTNLSYPLDQIRQINVQGTENVLELIASLKKKPRVNHISTAYIYGDYNGIFDESCLAVGQAFNTTYERSKFEAEKLVQEYRKKGLLINIYRPPIIIAHSKSGKAFHFRNIYQLLHICSLQLFDTLPISNPYVNIVPVDLLSEAIYAIFVNSKEDNLTFHPFPMQKISIEEIIDCGCRLMKVKKPKIAPLEDFDLSSLSVAKRIILENNIISMKFKARLNSEYTINLLNSFGYQFPELNSQVLENTLKYYIDNKILNSKS